MADLITLNEYKVFNGITDADIDRDNMLSSIISGWSLSVENYLDIGIASATRTEYYNGNGSNFINLNHYPVISITSITFDAQGEEPEVIAGSNFVVREDMGTVKFKPTSTNQRSFSAGWQNIKVIYVAGYATTPADIKMAMFRLVKQAHDSNQVSGIFKSESIPDYSYTLNDGFGAYNGQSFGIPNDVIFTLNKYKRVNVL